MIEEGSVAVEGCNELIVGTHKEQALRCELESTATGGQSQIHLLERIPPCAVVARDA